MSDVLVKKTSETGDDDLARYAFGDIDMVISPRDGALVVVTQDDAGVHVCPMCRKPFVNDPTHPHRSMEINPGGHGTRLLIHAAVECHQATLRSMEKQRTGGGAGAVKGNIVYDISRAHQARRVLTRLVKPFEGTARKVFSFFDE